MASIKGFQMKNVKTIVGREGYGCTGTMYLNGKKIGTYADYGDGGCSDIRYESMEARASMKKAVVEFAKENPCDMIIAWFKDNPVRFEEERRKFLEINPYIPEDDITMEVLSACKENYIVTKFLELQQYEKAFKKWQKKGFRAICVQIKGHTGDATITAFPNNWSDERIAEEMSVIDDAKLFKTLEDFNM